MDARRALIAAIEKETAGSVSLTGRSHLSPRLLAALAQVNRDAFVSADESAYAYENIPLPIGYGQTISQPFVVAIMTELLDLAPEDTVLEIGTGSGYQAAVLAALVKQVYSVERIRELADGARQALAREGYRNVEVRCGDGAQGWPEHAPYDAIIVTAAARTIPPALVEQLRPGGRMVIPVGKNPFEQSLTVLHKKADGEISRRDVLQVAFVPLVAGERNPS
ncbi:MAG TPA: protein-L-isoaspartate(D-aspartate) O-methyltransferase [Stellaceae bacterium]|nr:protein-L-isoaspartate(D-aspartate) O-methyltransferase [Stellaceae bacterium]